MNVIVDLCIVPVGVGVSLSPYVAVCEKILTDAGLKTVLHANGTNIEGEWDAVLAAVKRCHEELHQQGAPRIFTVMKLGTRIDRKQTMDDKVRSVKSKLSKSPKAPAHAKHG
ncbi:MAG: MTH1187 family thiamine-binding protein [Verrucomicrobiota bacterium]